MSAKNLASLGAQNCTVKCEKLVLHWRRLTCLAQIGHISLQTGHRFRLASPWRHHWR